MLLKEPKYLEIAEHQVQRVLGRNPRGLCTNMGEVYQVPVMAVMMACQYIHQAYETLGSEKP